MSLIISVFVELIKIEDKNQTKERLEAFKYFIGVVESPPNYDEYEEFKRIVNKYLEEPPFSFQTPFKVNKTIEKRVSLWRYYIFEKYGNPPTFFFSWGFWVVDVFG